jgi:putative tryptophan/tyrosine transport system substrate-binding protein
MKRRKFIAGLGSAVAWPLAVRAQQPAKPVIGFLHSQSLQSYAEFLPAFHRGLVETGFAEGKNVAIDYYWADGQVDRLLSIATEMVRKRYVVIVVFGSTPAALALKAATQTIPIVFQIGPDPVAVGLVASLNRPGGNLTGASTINVEVIAKRLEMLHELVPTAKSVALLVNPTNAAAALAETKEMQRAARVLGLSLVALNATTPAEIEAAFAIAFPEKAGALVVSGESFFYTHHDQVIALAARYRIPTIYVTRLVVAAGGLIGYGSDPTEPYRVVGAYAGRILKGEKPADLPVQLATRIELGINLKTAKTLGLAIPPDLLVRADEVIE